MGFVPKKWYHLKEWKAPQFPWGNTVDGRNPAPPEMFLKKTVKIGINYLLSGEPDFFHQQHLRFHTHQKVGSPSQFTPGRRLLKLWMAK